MPARLLLRERRVVGAGQFAEVVIWDLTESVPGSPHHFKYRLAFVVDEVFVIRFDNETGKGDHKHICEEQVPYTFTSLERLIADFWTAIDDWRPDEQG
jgi:Family of unknown function (DUF6516)